MKLTTRALPALFAIVVLGLPNAFAVDGKTICVDVDVPDSGTVTITLSPTEQPGVLRGLANHVGIRPLRWHAVPRNADSTMG